MFIENAVQATEVVKVFLEKMNPNMAFSPRKATFGSVLIGIPSEGKNWIVEVNWGFQSMTFKVRQSDGQILEYETGPTKVAKE